MFPLSQISYLLGVTKISFLDYAIGTLIGITPGIIVYCYLGVKMREAYEEGIDITMIIILVIIILCIYLITIISNEIINELKIEIENEEDEEILEEK